MIPQTIRSAVRQALPPKAVNTYRTFRDVRGIASLLGFLASDGVNLSFSQRADMVRKIFNVSTSMYCPHTNEEIVTVVRDILTMPSSVEGAIVECGCCKGGSSSKFSHAARIMNRKLILFDSFEGIPDNTEAHTKTIFGDEIVGHFAGGTFLGTLDEVQANIRACGDIGVCEFIKGWFDKTMPDFKRPLAMVFLDVDLAESTKTCLKYLYPLLSPGGIVWSQDGHLPLVIEAFDDDDFWRNEVGVPKPRIEGLGTRQLIRIQKT